MGNADHADIVHCRIRAELVCHLARVDLVSTSQDRCATATDDPHLSVLTDDAELTVSGTAFGDIERRDSAELRARPNTRPLTIMPLRSVASRV
jgi:hypothetical protein